jgi:hypothetical protein
MIGKEYQDVGNLSRLYLVAEVLDNLFSFRLVDNAGDVFCDGKVIDVLVAKLIVTLILAHQQAGVEKHPLAGFIGGDDVMFLIFVIELTEFLFRGAFHLLDEFEEREILQKVAKL